MQIENNNIIEREHEAIYQTYKRLPIVIERAEACRIFAENGDVYLDFLSGIAVNALGHSHPKIIEVIEDQVKKYLHVSNYFYQKPQIELAESLKRLSGLDKVFFSNSGTEAMEAAIKLIRKWSKQNGKKEIIGFSGGFHGRTYGALSIMDKPPYKEGMGPFLENCSVIPLNDIESLMSSINSETAAIVLEFIQGEGGISEPNNEFIEILDQLRNQHRFLIVADEIQAGIGRSGKFFAFEHFGIVPDIITVAKGMGGGLPLGGIIVSKELSEIWSKGNHGTTYGGNALACRTGMVVVDLLENGLLNHVVEMGEYLHSELFRVKEICSSNVLEVRGKGLMKGLLLNFDANILVNELLNNKVIANAASGYVLRIIPPLIVGKSEIDEFITILIDCLNNINKG